jgi:pimeloyl-ACP methyl ester carboxylesterase
MTDLLKTKFLSKALAFVAACSLFALRSSIVLAESKDPSVSQNDVVIQGVKIHYLRAGSGEPVVLVHGYPENSQTWRHVLPVLARHYTVIAPDTRGTGESAITADFQLRDAAEDIYGLVHQLGFRRVFLVGQDFGVQIVSAYAAMHRDDVRGLIVAESPLSGYGLEGFYAKFWHFGFLASPFAPLLIGDNIDPFFRKFAFSDFVYRKAAFSKAEIDNYIAAETRPGRLNAGLAYYRALQKDEPFFAKTVAPPWHFPVLSLDGDHSFNGQTAISFRRVASDLTTRIVPASGHFVQEEQPAFVSRAFLEFFRAH